MSTSSSSSSSSWSERAADRSPRVRRSRLRSVEQAQVIVDAARRLVDEKGENFTTHELVKEAGVALQTFYRYFAGKDELLLAMIEDWTNEGVELMVERGAQLDEPLERLRLYVTGFLEALVDDRLASTARFITAEHYRLHQIFPDELAEAARPYVDLLVTELRANAAVGLIDPVDVERDAWSVTQLAMATFHHYAYATHDESIDVVAEGLWTFCLRALAGPRQR